MKFLRDQDAFSSFHNYITFQIPIFPEFYLFQFFAAPQAMTARCQPCLVLFTIYLFRLGDALNKHTNSNLIDLNLGRFG